MTNLLEEAIIRLRGLPEDTQDAAARTIIRQLEEEPGSNNRFDAISVLGIITMLALLSFVGPPLGYGSVRCTIGVDGINSCSLLHEVDVNEVDATSTTGLITYPYDPIHDPITGVGETGLSSSDVGSSTKP